MKNAASENELQTENVKDMIHITLDSGLELDIDRSFTDDMELLDAMVEADEGNGMAMSQICSRILDKESKKKLYESIRVNGRVKTTTVVASLMEIIRKVGDAGKN